MSPGSSPQPLDRPGAALTHLSEKQKAEMGKEGDACVHLLGASQLNMSRRKRKLNSFRMGGIGGKIPTSLLVKDIWQSSSPASVQSKANF